MIEQDGEGVQTPHPDEVIETVHAVRDTMTTISDSLATIAAYGKRTRQIAVALVISLVLDLVLTVTVAVLSFNSISNSDAANSNVAAIRAVQYSSCLQANATRHDQIDLWNFFIALADQGPSVHNPQAQRQILALQQFVRKTFAPRNCKP